ncbi:hypothetical protein BXY80_0290 [Ichthyenterobacterium magnum]|uniref:Uncharacterized protein n=2 Tax=Ichthyenterobacterium magnum TaxID=1230530 RepID=A0A420DVG5_9FLAO|nr:hypothetical protein BXY80_0290 [Ichthyenterobacterium magnum]
MFFAIQISAQNNTFNEQFCDALKTLSKEVKKKRIKRASFDDITGKMSGLFGSTNQFVNTNHEFIKDYPLFQADYGLPMSGESRLVNDFNVLVNMSYVNLLDSETQKQIKIYLQDLSTTISDCNCKPINDNKVPVEIKKNKYYRLNWDCGKQGKIGLVVDTLELNEEATRFICYMNFGYISLY